MGYNWALRPVEYKIEIYGLVKYTIHKFCVYTKKGTQNQLGSEKNS